MVNIAGCRLVLSLKSNAASFRTAKAARSTVGVSSSFLIGTMGAYTYDDVCQYSSDNWKSEDFYELPELGTVYPERYQTHWEAL